MSQRVQVGNDVLEFPDGMDDKAIAAAIEKDYGKPKPTQAEDITKSAAAGVGKGVAGLAGLPGDAGKLIQAGWNYVAPKALQVTPEDEARVGGLRPATSRDVQSGMEKVTGEFYKPQTRAGRYAETVGTFAPGLAFGGGNVASRLASNVLGPGVTSEAAGELAQTYAPKWEGASRVAGALIGGHVPSAIGRVSTLTPFPARPGMTQAAQTLRNEGVDLTAGQATGNRRLRWAESVARDTPFAGGRAEEIVQNQGRQFTRAALRRMGEDADLATPDVMRRAATRLGNEFERLATGNDIVFAGRGAGRGGAARARNLTNETLRLEAEYNAAVQPSARNALVTDLVDDVNNAVASGRIVGTQYQPWRSRLSRMAENAESDPELRRFFGGMRNALDDAMASGLSPADQAAWQTARTQYGHMKELERAMLGAGERVAAGLITPQKLAEADRAASATGYVRGEGRYDDLARAGVEAMTELPNSGTAARSQISNTAALLGAGFGHMAVGDVPGALAGAGMGLAAPAIAGRVLMNPVTQRVLSNQTGAAPALSLQDARSPVAWALAGLNQGRDYYIDPETGQLTINITPKQ